MLSINSKVSRDVLTQLISELGFLLKDHDLVIDSRLVTKGSIFCAYPGTSSDGRDFIQNAIESGATIILYEPDMDSILSWNDRYRHCENVNNKVTTRHCEPHGEAIYSGVKYFPIKDLKLYVGLLAAEKHNHPSRKLETVGITGTNGKTSIAYWLNQVYTALKFKTAMIGTLGAGIYPEIKSHAITTPDPITLEKLLAKFVDDKVSLVAMEVSSHAIDQGRVNGIDFTTAVFTNLTQDHLDYHLNMENYYLAKRELFYWHGLKNVVINLDDEYGKRLYSEMMLCTRVIPDNNSIRIDLEPGIHSHNARNDKLRLITYGFLAGDVTASDIKVTISGTRFKLNYKAESIPVEVKVIGRFNVYNLLAVASVLLLDGHSLTKIATILPFLTPVCGRMDAIILPNKPLVVIDFSHTPDSLEKALSTLREVEHSGKLYCIFGCGGNRDNKKRPIMGEIAARLADVVIVTSDNPRFENSDYIIDQIVVGIKDKAYQRIENRTDAIESVLKVATANDIVLIAGKGHEDYQEINGTKHQFSDFTIARDFLSDR